MASEAAIEEALVKALEVELVKALEEELGEEADRDLCESCTMVLTGEQGVKGVSTLQAVSGCKDHHRNGCPRLSALPQSRTPPLAEALDG